MKPYRRLLTSAAAVCMLLVPAAGASAQSVLFADDAEGALEANWTITPPPDGIEPWQKSDSSTPKYRPNAAHGGATSYWAGASFPYPPVDVVQGEDIITLKNQILVPADGKTSIAFWSLFQNEGDDQGLVEASVGDGKWKKVAAVKLEPTSAGDPYVRNYCDPTHPAEVAQEDFEEIKGDLTPYAGKLISLRWNLKYGPENRSATQPCGWWVDDIAITTTGTPGNAGTAPTTPPVTTPPATPAKPSVKIGGIRSKGRKATLTLYVSGGPLTKAKLTLYKGKRKLGKASARKLADGTRRVTFKVRRKLPVRTYTVKIAARAPDGGKFKFKGATHDR